MSDETYERLLKAFWSILLILLAIFIISLVNGEKKVQGYYVSGSSEEAIKIRVDIDNYPDPFINTNGESWSRILQIVDSLNLTLKNKANK